MARNDTFKVLRTTRANLNTQAAANNLVVGEPYFITDESRFAIGTAVNAYEAFSRSNDPANDNLAVNGDFLFWDYGTSQTANGFGTANRWQLLNGSGATNTITRGTWALGATVAKGSPYYMLWARSVAGAGPSYWYQNVVSLRRTEAKKLTVTFRASSTANTELKVAVFQIFGTGGSPSTTVNVGDQEVSLTATHNQFSLVFDIPNIAGKTLGSNLNDYLQILFQRDHNDTNPTASVAISRVSFREGDVRFDLDPFIARSEPEERALCNWYRQVRTSLIIRDISGQAGTIYTPIQVSPMRAAPAVTFANTSYVDGSNVSGAVFADGGGYIGFLAGSAAVSALTTDILLNAEP